MSDFTDDAERDWGDAMAEGKLDTPSVTSHDTVSPSLSPTIDTELDTLLWHVQQAAFDQEGLADSSIAEIKAELKALIERENLRVTLELMEKHHIPLQTHTLDTELREVVRRFCRTEQAADNLVAIIERETARARIDELERLNFQEASGFISGGNMILRQSVVTKRIAALTSPHERKD